LSKRKRIIGRGLGIMTSHVHMALGTQGDNKLEDIIRDLKSYTSRHIRKYIENNPQESRKEWLLWIACPALDAGMRRAGQKKSNNKDFQFWLQHNHPIELSTNEILQQRLNYIHNNPVEARFVDNPSEWLYSSARDYEGKKGLIDIYFLD
jgi:putative transposase